MARRAAGDVVLFHCPDCGTDRLGEHGHLSWWDRLRAHGVTAHIACMGCRRLFAPRVVARGPVGTSERARLNLAVRAMAAAMVAAGDGDPRTWTAALELVRSCTVLDFGDTDLRSDLAQAPLEARLRGDLTLLATELSPRGAGQLLDRLSAVLDTGARVTAGQLQVLEACTDHLGFGGRPTNSASDPRGRGRRRVPVWRRHGPA